MGDDVAASTVTVNIANAAGGGNVTGTVNTRTGAGGTKTLGASNASGTNTYSGGIFLDGNLTTSSANSGAVLAFGGSTFDLKNQALTVTGAGDTEIRNPVINSTGTGRVLKLGTGALVLKGTNTFGGATVVSNGTLMVHGSLAGAVAISSGTVLSGTGTVSGVVTNNGTIAPGSGIATLTVGSTPILNGTLLMEINRNGGSPLADKLTRSGGGLTYSGALVVTNIGAVAQSGDTFTLFNASSYSGTFSSVTLPPGGTAHWKTNNLVVDGTITFTNNNPVAQNLVLGVARGGTISYSVIGVGKHSATDADGDVIAVTAVSAATNGTAGFTASNVTYTASGVVGSDTFTYTVSDPAGGTDTRTVTVMITDPEGFNRLSPPSVIGAGTVALSYLGVPNSSYALDWATNLTPPINWVGVETNTASASGSLLFTNSSAAAENYFRTRYVGP